MQRHLNHESMLLQHHHRFKLFKRIIILFNENKLYKGEQVYLIPLTLYFRSGYRIR